MPQPFWLSFGCFLELGKVSYLIWKRTFRAIYWYKNLTNSPADRYYLNVFWGLADLHQQPSIFWSVTLQPLVVDQATICHIKGYIHTFHMGHISIIWYIGLQSYQSHTRLLLIGLVHWRKHNWSRNIILCVNLNECYTCKGQIWCIEVGQQWFRVQP